MNFKDLVEQRISTTHFDPNFKITDKDFLEILELTRFTPSGYNAQPWEFLLIQDSERLQKVYKIGLNQQKILDAGNIVIVLGNTAFGRTDTEEILKNWADYREFDKDKLSSLKASLEKERDNWKEREMTLRNVSLAAMSFLLSAESLGFATCPMMGFKQFELIKFLELPKNIIPVMMITLGKPHPEKTQPEKMPKKEAQAIGMKEGYGKRFF